MGNMTLVLRHCDDSLTSAFAQLYLHCDEDELDLDREKGASVN
jgi:hypothetical protein